MPDEVQILITRADLPRADVEFGLDEKDFDLTKTKIWIDGAPVMRGEPKEGRIKVTAPLGDEPGTIVVTTEAGKFIGVINYDGTSGKIVRQAGSDKEPTVPGIVNDAVKQKDTFVRSKKSSLRAKSSTGSSKQRPIVLLKPSMGWGLKRKLDRKSGLRRRQSHGPPDQAPSRREARWATCRLGSSFSAEASLE